MHMKCSVDGISPFLFLQSNARKQVKLMKLDEGTCKPVNDTG